MTNSEVHGHIKLDKLWIPKKLISEKVKDSKDLTTLAMFVKLHFSSKSGVIKFNSVKEACDWFGISNSTYYKIRHTGFFKELFKVEKGYFKALSLKKGRNFKGLSIVLNGRLKTTEDYRLGVDITEESLSSIHGVKEILREALLVLQISTFEAKCEEGDKEGNQISVCRNAEAQFGREVSFAKIDDNVKPVAYFKKILGCSKTKAREILHRLRDKGYIGIQPTRKVTQEWEIEPIMEEMEAGRYDVLDATNRWNYKNTFGKTFMTFSGIYITQIPNRYWISQRQEVVMPDGSKRLRKKHTKTIHVPDYHWFQEYGEKKSEDEKEEERKIKRKIKRDYKKIEKTISRLRERATKDEDGLIHVGDTILTEKQFEASIKKFRKTNRETVRENAKNTFKSGIVYKTKKPKLKEEIETMANINYPELKACWMPVPLDKHGRPDYSTVSKDVERYDRYIKLPIEERNHLDNHPEIDLATEKGRSKLRNDFEAQKQEMVHTRLQRLYESTKWILEDPIWQDDQSSERAIRKFIEAYNYFKDSGRGIARRITLAEKLIAVMHKADVENKREQLHNDYCKKADEFEKMGYKSTADTMRKRAEEVLKEWVQVEKKTINECLADDEERDLIDEEVIKAFRLNELIMAYHTKTSWEGTPAGKMLLEFQDGVRRERDAKKMERQKRREERERIKREKALARKMRKEGILEGIS